MQNKYVCFSANRICHHDDYYLLLRNIVEIENVKLFSKKISCLFSKKNIVFLDIDSRDLLFTPIILMRSLWGGKGIAFSVRTEYLVHSRTICQFFFSRGRVVYLKSIVKRALFLMIKKISKTRILSIHKDSLFQDKIASYVDYFIYDPQLWDLKHLKIGESILPEIKEDYFNLNSNVILIAGRLNEQRSREELIDFLKAERNLSFLIAGVMTEEDNLFIAQFDNCKVINRFISNEELIYLMRKCSIIYCFYTNNRPSGFFGRALQLNKHIIVRKNSFLHLHFVNYAKLIPIKRLQELSHVALHDSKIKTMELYDDFEYLKKIILSI